MHALAVALGSALGGVARFGLTNMVHRFAGSEFPLGTLIINVAGCLGIGLLMHLVEDRMAVSDGVRVFVGVGLLGGFTTFSAFGYETLRLLRDGQNLYAILNILGNVIIGLLAVWLGRCGPRLMTG